MNLTKKRVLPLALTALIVILVLFVGSISAFELVRWRVSDKTPAPGQNITLGAEISKRYNEVIVWHPWKQEP